MFARTLHNNIITPKVVKASALAALGVLLFSACSSDSVIEEIREIDVNGTDKLAFTCLKQDVEQTTRAQSQALTTDFMVSTYKAFSTTSQQTVMQKYEVEYRTSGTAWDGTVRPYWDYTQVDGQYEKYWDYSAFPYRFHAIAPYPVDPSAITLSDKSLTINNPYKMQTSLNGLVTPADAEPHLVAQVQRDGLGNDLDVFANKDITGENHTANRYVSLPFHHLNSKVRFAIYCTAPWATANPMYIEGLTLTATSPNFVTQASGYTIANDTDSWYRGTQNSGFIGLTKQDNVQLFRFDGGVELQDNDLSLHQGQSSAYWMQCPDGIMQIPQEDVSIRASLKLRMRDDGSLKKEFDNIIVRLDDGVTSYDWQSGYIYTYYLIIEEVGEKLEISFTCTLTPWEDVTGSLSTDLEQ